MKDFHQRVCDSFRKCVAIAICIVCAAPSGWTQRQSIEPQRPGAASFLRPYLAPDVPPIRLANSARLRDLVRAGKLYLTAQDAIALALENDIDIEVARYNPLLYEWNLERIEADVRGLRRDLLTRGD